MELRRIRYFLELATVLNFSQAARRLGISQPALTKAIARLESEIGGKLIRREGKHTHLTAIGVSMRERFSEIDEAVKRAEMLARRLTRGSLAQLRIGVSDGVGPMRAARFIAAFVKRHPDTEIVLQDISRDDKHDALLSGQVDCSFICGVGDKSLDADGQRLHVLELYSEPLVVIAAGGDGKECGRGPMVGDIQSLVPRIGHIDSSLDGVALAATDTARVGKPMAIRSSRDDWTQALVNAGLGAAVVPRDSVLMEDLQSCDLEPAAATRMVSLAIPVGRIDTPVVRQFLELARQFDW